MSIEYCLSAEECAQEAQKYMSVPFAGAETCLSGIGWALLSIAVSLAEKKEEK